jgi:hypothetical protein
MSQVATYVDPGMLDVKALEYDSWQTVYFQRATVVVTELVLVYALHLYFILSHVDTRTQLTQIQLCQDVQVQSHCTRCSSINSTLSRSVDY